MRLLSAYKIWWIEFLAESGIVTKKDEMLLTYRKGWFKNEDRIQIIHRKPQTGKGVCKCDRKGKAVKALHS